MPRNSWTFLIIRGEDQPIRQVEVSRRTMRAAAAGAGSVVATLLVLLVGVGFGGTARYQAHTLAVRNDLLVEELDQMRDKVSGLEGSLAQLSETDRQMRVLAGLDPIDPEVLEVGIGGPGTASPESAPLFGVDADLARETFAVSFDLNALERRASLLESSFSETRDSLSAHRDLMLATPSILPTMGWLSSRFSRSRMHPVLHVARPHEGIDLTAPEGTPIMAAADGRVRFVGRKGQLGLAVEIDHGFGYVTRYGHASKLLVRNGQRVTRGDVIAQVGKTGLVTSAHLHYEVLVGGQAVNPLNFVVDGALP
jgi:murein DD-endopeptidase MepM/ murein hydrolase activator NlpD